MNGSDAEATRQQALLAAIAARAADASGPASLASLALRETGARAARGLAAYRSNAQALAERALAAAFPTVQAMLGEEDFAQLAHAHWHAHPPVRGDIGEWGGELPDAIEADAQLVAWPWLADCARLDLAVHRCERAADATSDAPSLARLGDTDPARLQLVPIPGLVVLVSAHPIATIHAAHRRAADDAGDAFAPVREAQAAGRGEAVCVARSGWRALVHPLDPGTARATQALFDGSDLAAALERAGAGFDFAAWLAQALSSGWLQGVALRAD